MKNIINRIVCYLQGHKFHFPTSLAWGYFSDKCLRCEKRFWGGYDFLEYGGVKSFWLSNKECILIQAPEYWKLLCEEFPELKELE